MELKPSHKIGELSDSEAEAVSLREAGSTMREVMAATGLNHSQAERAIMKATLTESDVAHFESLGADLGSRAVAGRAERISWGVMGILAGVPESAVRKAYEQAAQLKSKGQRIGHGGRFHYGDPGQPLYAEELKATGTAIPLGTKFEGALALSFTQRMANLSRERLVSLAERYGVPTKGKNAKTIINAIVKKAGYDQELAAKNENRMKELTAATAE